MVNGSHSAMVLNESLKTNSAEIGEKSDTVSTDQTIDQTIISLLKGLMVTYMPVLEGIKDELKKIQEQLEFLNE